jgi:hypothetical protein
LSTTYQTTQSHISEDSNFWVKILEGDGCGIFQSTIPVFGWRDWGKPKYLNERERERSDHFKAISWSSHGRMRITKRYTICICI